MLVVDVAWRWSGVNVLESGVELWGDKQGVGSLSDMAMFYLLLSARCSNYHRQTLGGSKRQSSVNIRPGAGIISPHGTEFESLPSLPAKWKLVQEPTRGSSTASPMTKSSSQISQGVGGSRFCLTGPEHYALTSTETSSGVQREVWRDLIASSAVSLPISSASFRLVVIWIGVRSSRCTNAWPCVPLRVNFTRNLVFFTFDSFYFTLLLRIYGSFCFRHSFIGRVTTPASPESYVRPPFRAKGQHLLPHSYACIIAIMSRAQLHNSTVE
jgi:hypothetical protein